MKMETIGKKIPEWLFPIFAMGYWAIHPHRQAALIIPSKGIWHIIRKDGNFWTPSPKRDGQNSFIYNEHGYERFYNITRGDVILDIGAHIGRFSCSVAPRCEEVICIEPEVRNLKCLRLNTQKFNNIQIIPKAVSDKKEMKRLFLSDNPMCHTLINNFNYVESNFFKIGDTLVVADTLDNIVSELNLNKIDFIKIDVEGAEIAALKGAEHTLKKVKYVAISTGHFIDGTKTTDAVRTLLENNGFVTRVDEKPHDVTYGMKTEMGDL